MFYVKIKKKDLGKDASVREDFAQTEDALRMSIRRHWIRRWVLQSIQEILSDASNDKISIWNNFYRNLLWMFIIIFYLTSCNIEYVITWFFFTIIIFSYFFANTFDSKIFKLQQKWDSRRSFSIFHRKSCHVMNFNFDMKMQFLCILFLNARENSVLCAQKLQKWHFEF